MCRRSWRGVLYGESISAMPTMAMLLKRGSARIVASSAVSNSLSAAVRVLTAGIVAGGAEEQGAG